MFQHPPASHLQLQVPKDLFIWPRPVKFTKPQSWGGGHGFDTEFTHNSKAICIYLDRTLEGLQSPTTRQHLPITGYSASLFSRASRPQATCLRGLSTKQFQCFQASQSSESFHPLYSQSPWTLRHPAAWTLVTFHVFTLSLNIFDDRTSQSCLLPGFSNILNTKFIAVVQISGLWTQLPKQHFHADVL